MVPLVFVFVRVSIAMERSHDHSSSWKEKHFIGLAHIYSEVQFIVRVGHGGGQAGMVLEE